MFRQFLYVAAIVLALASSRCRGRHDDEAATEESDGTHHRDRPEHDRHKSAP